jgi:hypothetical protein
MKRIVLGIIGILTAGIINAQVAPTDTTTNAPMNSAQNILSGNYGKQIIIGGYAQIDYNQPISDTASANGKMDVHRMIILMGYKFNDRVQFVTEIEMEHVKELYVEQAFLNYRISNPFNFRAGLMLIPMGIINEYHEPTTFNGVERPNLDAKIVPTTVNGYLGYDGAGTLRGSDGFRKGRQKGAESTISSPNFSTKLDYYGIKGLKLGAAAYLGNTQSTLYDGLPNNDTLGLKEQADSSIVGLTMFGIDARYQYKGLQLRGQVIKADIANSEEYNLFTGKDLGSSMFGYYGEVGYDVLSLFKKNAKEKLILFGRYEFYDTHYKTPNGTDTNDSFARTDITMGVTYMVGNGAALKADYQIFDNKVSDNTPSSQLNFGVGVWF